MWWWFELMQKNSSVHSLSPLPSHFLTNHLFLHFSIPHFLALSLSLSFAQTILQFLRNWAKTAWLKNLSRAISKPCWNKLFPTYPFANISSFFLSCLLHATAVQLEAVLCWILTIRLRIAASPRDCFVWYWNCIAIGKNCSHSVVSKNCWRERLRRKILEMNLSPRSQPAARSGNA